MNYKVDKDKVLFADECFQINGICFYVQKKLGRFAKEKQFADSFEERLKELDIPYRRELTATGTGNRIDFVIYDKILLEIKAKPFLSQEDFAQVKRYLQILNLQLGNL
jgi:GxxExxY protein